MQKLLSLLSGQEAGDGQNKKAGSAQHNQIIIQATERQAEAVFQNNIATYSHSSWTILPPVHIVLGDLCPPLDREDGPHIHSLLLVPDRLGVAYATAR